MKTVAVGTIVAKNYLPFARVLARSFQKFHPGIPFFVLLADDVDGFFAPNVEPFRLLRLEDLAISYLPRFRFQYSRQGLIIGAKPYLVSHLLDRGFSQVIFLDADILIFNDLTPLLAQVAQQAIVLTPHLLTPPVDERRCQRELNILLSGVYNGGFLGVSNSPTARAFLTWWQDRLYDHCRHDVAQGMYYDQHWLDLAPVFFEGVYVVRDSGCNVAYWNLPERAISYQRGEVLVDGQPCRFFHFSGFDPNQPQVPTRYYPQMTMANIGPAATLFQHYADLLENAGYQQTKTWAYCYGYFDNGVPVPDVARQLYRELGDKTDCFGDPLQTGGPGSFFHWLNEPIDIASRTGLVVTRLWKAIYDQRPDLRHTFPDLLGAHRKAYLAWAAQSGPKEYGIAECFLPQLHRPGKV